MSPPSFLLPRRNTSETNPGAAVGLRECAYDEALVQPEALAFLDAALGVTQDVLTNAGASPCLEPAVHGARIAEAPWQILSLRVVVERSLDTAHHCAFVYRRPTPGGLVARSETRTNSQSNCSSATLSAKRRHPQPAQRVSGSS